MRKMKTIKNSRFFHALSSIGPSQGGPANHVLTTFSRSGPLWELRVAKITPQGAKTIPDHPKMTPKAPKNESQREILDSKTPPGGHKINDSMNQWIDKSMNRWVDESMNQWSEGSMNRWMNETRNRWINESIGRWINESMYRCIDESMNRWINESMN